jgi:hypothetical protein
MAPCLNHHEWWAGQQTRVRFNCVNGPVAEILTSIEERKGLAWLQSHFDSACSFRCYICLNPSILLEILYTTFPGRRVAQSLVWSLLVVFRDPLGGLLSDFELTLVWCIKNTPLG